MASLAEKICIPCRGGIPALAGAELAAIYDQLPGKEHWTVVDEHHIVRTFAFPDFKQAWTSSTEWAPSRRSRVIILTSS